MCCVNMVIDLDIDHLVWSTVDTLIDLEFFLNIKLLKLDDIMTFQLGTFMYKLKYNSIINYQV